MKQLFKFFIATSMIVLVSGCASNTTSQPANISNAKTNTGSTQLDKPESAPPVTENKPVTNEITPNVKTIIKVLDDFKPIAKKCADDKSINGLKPCNTFIEQRMKGDMAAMPLTMLLDAGFIFTPDTIQPDGSSDYKYIVEPKTPDGKPKAFRLSMAVIGDQVKVIEGQWLDAGKTWLGEHRDYQVRWTR